MNARKIFILLVLLMGFIVLSSSVIQAQIYVSVTQGDDTFGNGTITTPYSSIGKAITVAASGSTIMVEAGTYNATTVKPAQTPGTGEDVLAVTGTQSLTFVAYARGIDVTVIVTNGIEINTSGTVSMGQTGETFNLGATANALKLTKGTMNIASSKVVMGNGATLTVTDGVLNAAPTATTNLNVIFNGVNALASTSAFLPSALGTGTVVINKATGALTIDNASLGAASITITNTAAVTVGSNVTTGAISVAGGTAAVTFNGSVTATGNITNASAAALTLNGNVAVGSATAGAAADILNTSTGSIVVGASSANTLTLSTTIDAGGNAGTDAYHSEIVNSSTGTITVNAAVTENIKNTGIATDAGDGYAIVSTRPLINNTGGGAAAITINGAITFNNTNVQGTTAGANDVSHTVIINNSGAGTVAIAGSLTTPARSGFTNTTAVSVAVVNSGGGTLTTRAAALRGVAGTTGINNGASGTMTLGLVGDPFTASWDIVNAGTTLTLNGTGALGGALTNNAACLVVLGADQTIAGLVTNNGNIKVNATTLTLTRTAAAALAGNGDIYSVTTATTGSGIVKFTGDVATSTYTGKLPNVEVACKTSFANVGNVIYGNLVTSNTGTVSLATAATDVKANLNLGGTGAVTINFATTVRGDLNLTAAASLTLAADLTVEGTFNMPQGIFDFGANNTLTLKGNFNRTGGTIGAAQAGTGSLVFNGNNSQTFTPGVQMNVYNVTVNNLGTYVAGFVEDQNIVTVTGALLVHNDFTITKGLVDMGINNIRMEQTTGSARFTNDDRGYTATGIGGLIFEGDGANAAGAGDGAVITGTKPFSNIYVRLTTAANNVYCLGAVVISGTVTLDGGGIIWNAADDGADLFTASTLTLDQSLTGTAYPTVVINTVNAHGSPFLVDGADGGAAALAITTYYNLSYTGNTNATMSATDFVTGKVNNLSVINGGSSKTITGLGGPMAIVGNLTVNALETLNLTNGGAQTLTLSSNAGAHAVSGTVTGGTLAVTGNAASLTGGVGTTNASSVAILTVTNASGTFTSTGMKVLNDVTMNGASLVSNITMNSATATVTTFVNTAGTTALNMNSTASAILGNFTVTSGAVTLTMNGAAAATRTITGNVAVNGGSLTLGSTINVTGTVGQAGTGSIALGNNNLILANNYTHAGTGTVTAGTGAVVAEISAAATVRTYTLTSTVTIPNLTVNASGAGSGIQLVTNGLTVSNALVHTAGSIDLNSLPLTISGNTYTYTAGTYTAGGATGIINLTGKNTVIGGAGSPTIPYLTINSDSLVTINPTGSPATARTITISNLLTQTKGTVALGINDIILNAGTGYTFTAGAITAATSTAAANTNVGELVFNGATGFTPGAAKSLTIPNLRIDAATAVAGTDSFYVANRLTFGVGSLTCAAGRMILNNNVAIYRTGAGTLSAAPQFAGVVDVTYMTTGTTTGPELPTSSTALRNLTINVATTLGAPVKTNGTLTLAAAFTTTAPNVDTLAVGSTVAVNGGSISAPVIPLGAYNLSYTHNANVTTTNNEWPAAASITNLTVAMNAADLRMNANRTVTNFTLNCTNGGRIDLSNGGATPYTLTVTGLTTLTAGTLMTTAPGGTLVVQGDVDAAGGAFGATVQMSFTGSSNQTITTPTGGAVIGNITINKTSGSNSVVIAGGDLTCGGTVTFINGLLKTGATNGLVLTNAGGVSTNKGFVRNITTGGKSHVVGNVRQNLQFSNLIAYARNEFPVGDTANYRPVALTFVNPAGSGNFGITATVSHTNSRPTGTAGLPIVNGIVDGVDLAKYPSFFWSIKTDGPMGATAFNLDLTAAGFDPAELDLDDIGLNRVKIIRRSGVADDIANQWNLQGVRDSYDNVISAGVPNVTAINATGGLSASGAIFTYGLKSTLFVQNPIADQSLTGAGSTFKLKLNTTAAPVFGGNTGALAFTTNSSNTSIATASITAAGDTLVVRSVSDGVAVITVTGTDIDNSQISTQFNVTVGGTVDVVVADIPKAFALLQNHPNPFNPTTNISFDVPQNSSVKIVIYDMLGREVTTLVNKNYTPGRYTVPFNASRLSSGMYIYRMTSQSTSGETFTSVKKLMLVK